MTVAAVPVAGAAGGVSGSRESLAGTATVLTSAETAGATVAETDSGLPGIVSLMDIVLILRHQASLGLVPVGYSGAATEGLRVLPLASAKVGAYLSSTVGSSVPSLSCPRGTPLLGTKACNR